MKIPKFVYTLGQVDDDLIAAAAAPVASEVSVPPLPV